MSDENRQHDERLPDFYLPPAVEGLPIDPQVRAVAERLWPWAWNYIGTRLGDYAASAELADQVAYRISRHLKKHPGKVRSLVALYYTATANLVRTVKSHDGRIDYRGLAQNLEFLVTADEPDWQDQIELWILAEEIGQHFEAEIREMFCLRLLEWGWEDIGRHLGLTAGQARLRFRRALEKLPNDVRECLLPDREEDDKRVPRTPERGRT